MSSVISLNLGVGHGVDGLLRAVYDEMVSDPTSELAVSTGWSSNKAFLDKPGVPSALRDLLQWHLKAHLDLRLMNSGAVSGWANVMRHGQEVRLHDHQRSHMGGWNVLAGVMHLTDGEPLVLVSQGAIKLVPCQVGWVHFFSSFALHGVPPIQGHSDRVSIAFNVMANDGSQPSSNLLETHQVTRK